MVLRDSSLGVALWRELVGLARFRLAVTLVGRRLAGQV
jgi:hypothetical protein